MSKTAIFVKDAPDALKKEWNLFKDELDEEISRIEDLGDAEDQSKKVALKDNVPEDLQEKIDLMRVKLSNLSKRIEDFN